LSHEQFKTACLWIDVEGFVEQVLQGARNTLSKSIVVYAELESSPVWEGQTLAPRIITSLEDEGFVLVARDCQKWFQFNALFVRKEVLEAEWLVSAVERFAAEAKTAFLSN
jgi:hypothetical protein